MTVESFGELMAALRHFGPEHRAEVLARKGVDEAARLKEERRWTAAMVDAAANEDTGLVEAFGLAFAKERRRLREECVALSSLGPLPEVSSEPVAREGRSTLGIAPTAHPVVTAPAAPDVEEVRREMSGPQAGRRELAVPTYLRVPAVQHSPEDSFDFDPDATQAPFKNPLPAIPFSGTTTPERMRQIAGPPPSKPAADSGETVALPSEEERRELLELARALREEQAKKRAEAEAARPTQHIERGTVALPDGAPAGAATPFEEIRPEAVDLSMFPIERYAEITVTLSKSDDRAQVLRRFVLTEGMWHAVAQAWASRINEDPKLRGEFLAAVERARRNQ